MKSAIVVGTGAGGATVAKELQGHFNVTVLEAGREFNPFSTDLSRVCRMKRFGLLFDEREISFLFRSMKVTRTSESMALVKGIGLGGTTTIATGNGLRLDAVLSKYGIELTREYEELEREIPISTAHRKRWHKTTRKLFEVCQDLHLDPLPMPKMGDSSKCISCGRCVLGCSNGAKWDSRQFLNDALAKGAKLRTGCVVERIEVNGGRAIGVRARNGLGSRLHSADLVVIAAGGLGTPVILQNSGIECERTLFVDPVLTVAAEWKGCGQNKEIAMPFVVQRNGFILSPYFDYLSYFFRDDWGFAPQDVLGIMIKIADRCEGSVANRSVDKTLTQEDLERLSEGVKTCYEIFSRMGIKESGIVLGTLNAGHPGGTLPLNGEETKTFHSSRLPSNVFVADATLLPTSLGNPPMLTIMAMAKRVSRACLEFA